MTLAPDPIENPDGSTTHTLTKLRVVLLSLDTPQYTIAGACGIHPSTLSEYVIGKKDIKAEHLISLCEFLQVEPEQILGWIEVTV